MLTGRTYLVSSETESGTILRIPGRRYLGELVYYAN